MEDRIEKRTDCICPEQLSRCEQHEWVVFSTALAEGWLMLQCVRCGTHGTVNDPTSDEWSAAFYAPDQPYQWKDDARVTVRGKGPAYVLPCSPKSIMSATDEIKQLACDEIAREAMAKWVSRKNKVKAVSCEFWHGNGEMYAVLRAESNELAACFMITNRGLRLCGQGNRSPMIPVELVAIEE